MSFGRENDRILEYQAMQQKRKLRFDDLRKQLDQTNVEIHWKAEAIERSINYAETNKLKKEIQELKQQKILLVKEIEIRIKNKTMLKERGRLKSIGFRNGSGRTKML